MVLCSHLELVPDTKLCAQLLPFAPSDAILKLELRREPEKSGIALELIKTVSTQGSCAYLSVRVQGLDGA